MNEEAKGALTLFAAEIVHILHSNRDLRDQLDVIEKLVSDWTTANNLDIYGVVTIGPDDYSLHKIGDSTYLRRTPEGFLEILESKRED